MGYRFVSDLNQTEYDQFIENSSMVCFMQDYNWYKVKTGWLYHYHCGLYRDGELVAVCLLLGRNLFKGIKFFYSPRGYVIDFTDEEVLREMTKAIKKFAKSKGAYVVRIDPYFCISDYSFKENEKIEHNFADQYETKHRNLLKLGYKHRKLAMHIDEAIQPRTHIAIPLCDTDSNIITADEVRRKIKKIKPYLGQYQDRRGVTFEITQDEDRVKDLIEVFKATEKKHNLILRNEDYMIRFLHNCQGYLFFARIHFQKYLDFLKDDEFATPEKIAEVKALQAEHGESMILSGAFVILPPNKQGIRASEYFLAGNRFELNKLNTSAALVFETVKFSINHGCHYCDMGGVDGTLQDPLTIFKRKFNSRILEFAGEYDLPASWLYYPINACYPMLLKLYRFYIAKRYGKSKEREE